MQTSEPTYVAFSVDATGAAGFAAAGAAAFCATALADARKKPSQTAAAYRFIIDPGR
jgi:hypothetical protein